MSLEVKLLQFSNLLSIANLSTPDCYEKQEELIATFRKLKLPFLATMPERSQYFCEKCKVTRGNSIFYFENPKASSEVVAENLMWGVPIGAWTQIKSEKLHGVLAHGEEPSIELQRLLKYINV